VFLSKQNYNMSVASNNQGDKEKNKNSSSFDKNKSEDANEGLSDIFKKELIEKIKKGAKEKMEKLENSEKIKNRQNLNGPESEKSGIPQLDSPSRSNLLPQNQRIESRENKTNSEKPGIPQLDSPSKSNLLPQNQRIESREDKTNRIKTESQSDMRIEEMRSEAREKAKSESEDALKHIQDRRARLVIELAGKHAEQVAYAIAIKMAKAADDGGIMAYFVMTLSLFLALVKDGIDIAEIELLIFLATVVAIPVVIAIEGILWFINFAITLINIYFWTILLEGGHKKWFWKIFYRSIALSGLDFIPAFDVVPFCTLMVAWNISDYYKARKEAREDYKKFIGDFKSTGKINGKLAKKYGASV